MSFKQEPIVHRRIDENGDIVLQFPVTIPENIEGGQFKYDVYSRTGVLLGNCKNYMQATDLNTITTPGMYYLGYYGHSNSPADTSINGVLIVDGQMVNDYVVQTLYETGAAGSNTARVYYRKCIGGIWSNWKTQLIAESVNTNINGYLHLNNGLVFMWQRRTITTKEVLVTKPLPCTTLILSVTDASAEVSTVDTFGWDIDKSTNTTDTIYSASTVGGIVLWWVGKV